MGISKRTITTSNSQLGPRESGAGNAKYTPAAASIATNAGQLGSRTICMLIKLHFTPTYSSWLNQIELWFAKIERDVIARGVFTSLADLSRKLMKYIRHYNQAPKTVKWRHFDPMRRITPSSIVTVH